MSSLEKRLERIVSIGFFNTVDSANRKKTAVPNTKLPIKAPLLKH